MNRIIPRRSLPALLLLLALLCTHHLRAQNPDAWDHRFSLPGIIGTVYDVHLDDAGNAYFTGEIYGADDLVLRSPAVRWNGSEWQSLHDGAEVRVGDVRVAIESRLSTALVGNDVIAIGRGLGSGNTHYIMRLRDGIWEPVGDAFDRTPRTVVAAGNAIYVGGDFKRIGADSIEALARWDGASWRSVSSEIEGTVADIFIDERGHILVAGGFTAGSAMNAARWDGATWHSVGLDSLSYIADIASAGESVYALHEGALYRATASGYARLSSPVDSNATFNKLLAIDSIGRLYVAALPITFEAPGIIYRISGEDISVLSDAFDDPVHGMAISPDGVVYVGGEFTNVGGRPLLGVAVITSAGWEAPGSAGRSHYGLVGKPSRAAFLNDVEFVVAGEDLTTTVLRTPGRLLHWTGDSWKGVDPPYRGVITDVEEEGVSGIIVAFTETDLATPRTIVARWSGSIWEPIGNSLPYNIGDIFVRGSEILAVGSSNGVGAVLRWNGRTWDRITDNVRGIVRCGVIRDDGEIVIGGEFDSVGAVPAGNIASWRQGSWRAMGNVRYVKQQVVGPTTVAAVYAIEADRDRLYIGGQFDRIDTILSTNIALRDGTGWRSMDSGLSGRFQIGHVLMEYPAKVTSIVSSGSDVIVGGEFWIAGSINTRVRTDNAVVVGNLAVFDTTSEIWSEAGGKVQGWQYNRVNDLAIRNGSLLITGTFFRAGNSPSHNVALNTDLSKRLNAEVAERDLRFDATPVHRESVKHLTIGNPASSTRTLSFTIEIVSGPFRAQQHAIRLGPGETRAVPITFTPMATGPAYGLARIHHNATAHDGTPPIDVSLFGNGTSLDVYAGVTPNPVDFGRIVVNRRKDLPVIISNSTASNGSLSYSVDTSAIAPFTIIRKDRRRFQRYTLAPGESDTLIIAIHATDRGTVASSITVEHDAKGTPTHLVLPLRAEAFGQPPYYTLTPRRLDFGRRWITDQPDTLELVIGNPELAQFDIGYHLTGITPPFSFADADDLSASGTLVEGAADTIRVIFAPERSQVYSDTIALVINGPAQGGEFIAVSAIADGYAGMIVTPLEIDFGMVAVGQEPEEWIDIVVPDTALLDLALAADAPSDPFIVGGIPDRMPPGTTHRIPVRFAPSEPGAFNDVLLIEHNVVHLSNPLPISVRGSAQFVDDVPGGTTGNDVMLSAPRPNPATVHTELTITLSKPIHVQLVVIDAAGRTIAKLVDDVLSEGIHRLEWNTRNVAEGAYVLRLDAENVRHVRRVIIAR